MGYKIAVNTRLLLPDRLDGIGRYTYETLRRITRAHPEHEFLFLFDRPYAHECLFAPNVTPLVIPPPTRHPLLWYLWFEWSLPCIFRKTHPDLFLSPDGFLSLSSRIPSIAVIHDINFHHRPEDLPFFSRVFYRYYFPRYAHKATRIVTVSECSRNDIAVSYGIEPSRISLTPNGANPQYVPLENDIKEKIRNIYTGGSEYFISIGSMHPRKNIPRLLQAFDLFKANNHADTKLVVVGARWFGNRQLDDTYNAMRYRNDVVFTGWLSSEKLRFALGAASALVFVPLIEGFGIPLIEAMNCDVPVIGSSVSSIPEVAGDAALYADPMDPASVAMAMEKLWYDKTLRKNLILKGRERRKIYSWDITAARLWETISNVLES